MKLASSFSLGITLVLAAKIAPVCAAAPLVPPPTAQEILIDQWSDADYRLSCKRPANTILIPAAIPNIEGRAGVVKLSSGIFSGTVRGLDASKGAEGLLMEFISESLEGAEGGPGFEFRVLPIGGRVSERSFGELVPFLGEQALCVRLLDERPEIQLVLELRIIERNGVALRFVVSGPLAAIHEDGRGFEPFFDAFSLSKGEFKHRATPPNAPDFDGPGYTVRGGVLASGELGLRMEAPKGWRIESRLLAMDWSFASHALFVSPGTEGRVTVGTNVHKQWDSPPEAPADQASPSSLNFAGQQVAIKEVYPSGSRGRLRVQQGVLEVPEGQNGPVEARLQLVLVREHVTKVDVA
ncbi:MAG: hypothetical protein GY930_12240 [bacterium]|nr:hypothetical protein [bacterium]